MVAKAGFGWLVGRGEMTKGGVGCNEVKENDAKVTERWTDRMG